MKIRDLYQAEFCPEEFLDQEVIFHDDWSDYEENGWVVIFDFFGEIMKWEYSYCIFAEDNSIHFDPYPISQKELEWEIEQWKNIEDKYHGGY